MAESPKQVLLTGGSGMVGTAITDHLGAPDYEFTVLDPEPHPDCRTIEAGVDDAAAVRSACEGMDAVVHLAVYPQGLHDEEWGRIVDVNITGTYNVMNAADDAGVPTVAFASTNHVVGMYETEFAPDIYDSDFIVDHTDPVRPDSFYAVSKLLAEHMGRFYVECRDIERFYTLRICSLYPEEYDRPYGAAELHVAEGNFERDSEAYRREAERMKAMWLSRRDCAQLFELMLENDATDAFDIFYGVSGNETRFHDISHAQEVLGYEPRDDSGEWGAPPE